MRVRANNIEAPLSVRVDSSWEECSCDRRGVQDRNHVSPLRKNVFCTVNGKTGTTSSRTTNPTGIYLDVQCSKSLVCVLDYDLCWLIFGQSVQDESCLRKTKQRPYTKLEVYSLIVFSCSHNSIDFFLGHPSFRDTQLFPNRNQKK